MDLLCGLLIASGTIIALAGTEDLQSANANDEFEAVPSTQADPAGSADMYIQPAKSQYTYFTHSTFFVTCYPDAGSSSSRLVWTAPDGREITTTHGRIHIVPPSDNDPGLKLVVEDVLEHDKGRYTCSSMTDSRHVSLNLTVYKAISFEGTMDEQSGTEGQDFTLKCHIEAESKPDVSWNRGSAPVKDRKKYQLTEEGLLIRNLSRHDAGNYTCQAFVATPHLTGVDQKILTLTVLYGPKLKQPVQEAAYTTFGSTAVLHCEAEGSPEPNILWFRDDGGIEDDDEHEIIGDVGFSTLKIKITDQAQFGEYTCRVSNDLGVVEQVIVLKEGETPKAPIVSVVDSNPNALVLKIEHSGRDPLKVDGFRVEYKTDADSWETAATEEYPSGNGIQYTLKNLNHDTSYAIRVSARNAAGYGDFSEEIYHRTKDPQHFTQSNRGGGRLSLNGKLGVVVLSTGYLILLKL